MSAPQPSLATIVWIAVLQLALTAGMIRTGPSVQPAAKLAWKRRMLRRSWSSETTNTGEPYCRAISTVSTCSMNKWPSRVLNASSMRPDACMGAPRVSGLFQSGLAKRFGQ